MKTRLFSGIVFFFALILSSGSLFAQWAPISNLQYVRISGILIINDTTVFLGGYSGAFLKSTDAGENWTRVTPSGMGTDSIFSLDRCGSFLFAGTNPPVSLYRSSDYGESWSAAGENLPANTSVNDMTYLDSVTYAATNNGVLSSTDNGTTWKADTVGLSLGQPPYQFPVVYGTIGITSSGSRLFAIESESGNGVYSTPADSVDWKNMGLDTLSCYAITSIDTDVFVGTNKGVYLYGGSSTWLNRSQGLPLSDTASVTDVRFTGNDSILFAYFELSSSTFYGHELYYTTDLGRSWKKVDIAGLNNSPVSAIALNGNYLFAGTESGAYEIPISDLATAVHNGPPQLPASFSLSQNYPNPFNPTTEIEFRIADLGFVTLKVYNVLGQEVATLVNGMKRPGEYSVIFSGAGLSSGVYFYTLEEGSYHKTMKMILLK